MGKRKTNKRQETFEEVAALVDLEEGWLDELLQLPTDELAKVLGEIANHGKIKTADIEMARASLSGAKWAERFGLVDKLKDNRFERVVTPMYRLPPSVHQIMFKAALHTQDVYQEQQAQRNEAAKFKIMDSVCPQSRLLCFSDLKICQVSCSHHRAISRSSNRQTGARYVREWVRYWRRSRA